MQQEAPELQQRLSDLQAQIDQLSLSLHLWQKPQQPPEPVERRLLQLTERCTEALDRWNSATEGFREQTASLTEACLATANTTQSGFDRAEVRLAALEDTLHRQMAELSRELNSALGDPRGNGTEAGWEMARSGSQAWPLEGVVRLHNELRQSVDGEGEVDADGKAVQTVPPAAAKSRLQLPENAASLRARVSQLERALTDGQAETREATERSERRTSRSVRAAVAVLTLGFGAAGALGWRLEQRMSTAAVRAEAAEHQAQAATEAADQRIAAARADATREIAEARRTAARAQTIADVLSAPDLVRYNLTGGATPASAQVLWSRTRGFVFSGSRLPAPSGDATYQIWLLTGAEPVSGGLFVPDSSGRVTLANGEPPRLSKPLIGINVTLEPHGGRALPTGETILARPQPTAQVKPLLDGDGSASERRADAR